MSRAGHGLPPLAEPPEQDIRKRFRLQRRQPHAASVSREYRSDQSPPLGGTKHLDGACHDEKVSLPIRREVTNDLLRGNLGPGVV
jgi:hypothetical protein